MITNKNGKIYCMPCWTYAWCHFQLCTTVLKNVVFIGLKFRILVFGCSSISLRTEEIAPIALKEWCRSVMLTLSADKRKNITAKAKFCKLGDILNWEALVIFLHLANLSTGKTSSSHQKPPQVWKISIKSSWCKVRWKIRATNLLHGLQMICSLYELSRIVSNWS